MFQLLSLRLFPYSDQSISFALGISVISNKLPFDIQMDPNKASKISQNQKYATAEVRICSWHYI